jgi:uncharacterized membrane protein YkoI
MKTSRAVLRRLVLGSWIFSGAWILVLGAFPVLATKIPWPQIPDAAKEEAKHFVNGEPSAETHLEKGQTIYHFSGKKNGKQNEVDFSASGKFLYLEQHLGLGGCPKPVQNAIRPRINGGKVEQVTRYADTEQSSYEAEISKEDRTSFVEVDKDGKLLSEETETDLAQVPAAVQSTIKSELNNAQISYLGKVVESGDTSFHVEANNGTKDFEFWVAEDGDLLRRVLTFVEVPAAVQKAIQPRMGHDPDVTIVKDCESGDCQYTVEFIGTTNEHSLVVDIKGTLISESQLVPLDQTPEAVQKLIKTETDGATVGSITKTQETDTLYYEIEVTRDGSDESFEATPDGKILD